MKSIGDREKEIEKKLTTTRRILKGIDYKDTTFRRVPISRFSVDELCKILTLVARRRQKEVDELLGET